MQSTKQQISSNKKTTIVNSGDSYYLYGDIGLVDVLPLNTVLELKVDPKLNISLERAKDITLPKKIYSNDKVFIKHVLKSYENASTSLGILLSGEKGLGKSFTGNVICKTLGLPVIKIVGRVPVGADLFGFLNKIEQEHIIFIDEFEKMFSMHNSVDSEYINQEAFLSFLDNGSMSNKRLFLITSNEYVSHFLLNRPTRLRYHRKYETMEVSVIKEIVNDLLINQSFKENLIENVPQKKVNIDVLIKIIEEVNLHNKPYTEFKSFFNFSGDEYETFTVTNNTGLQEEAQIKMPIRNRTYICDNGEGTEMTVDTIISQTPTEYVVRVCMVDYESKSKNNPYTYDILTLKRRVEFLF